MKPRYPGTKRLMPCAEIIAGVLWQALTVNAMAMGAEEVFEMSSPAVVQLKSVDSEGSGVVIHENGWILTNLHVAASGTPMAVAVSDKDGNITRKIEGATLFRVHPTEDLAILKFNPGAAKLAVARIAAVGQEPKPASTCFAISSPAGNAGALTNTITQGIVSTPRRKLEDRECIQFSAAVSAGSSGGALLDRDARLIGLITSKQDGGEGVAFATPLVGIDWKVFVDPAKRSGNKQRYDKAIEISAKARFAGALQIFGNPGGHLPDQLAAAAYYSRLALTEFPSDETAFRGLIEVYYLAGKQDVCLELARSATRATGASEFLSLEARSLSLLGKEDEAYRVYSKTLAAEDGKASPLAAGTMAGILSKRNVVDWGRVAYLARWGYVSQESNNEAGKREISELFEKAVAKLPVSAARAIRAKQSDFTLAEMRDFPAKLPKMPKGDAELMKAFDPAFYQPVLASSAGPLVLSPDSIPKSNHDPESDFSITVENRVDTVIPAAGGRIALLVSTESETVYLFDVSRGGAISKTECPKGTLAGNWVVGGLDHWALVDKKQFRYQRFPLLKSAEPEIIEPKGVKIPWDAFGAKMSPYRDDLLWILLREPDGRVSVAIHSFDTGVIRTPDLSGVPVDSLRKWGHYSHPRFRIDPAGMTLAPEGGAEVILTVDPVAFRLQALRANYAFHEMSFPYVNTPASWFLDAHSAKNLSTGAMVEKWSAEGDGWMGTPLWMGPVHGSPQVLQLSHGSRLMIQIRDPDTGECVLPIKETAYSYYQDEGGRPLGDPKRFEVIAHRSSPRILIFDFLSNKLLSVKMIDWNHMGEHPLVIRRKPGSEVRLPFKPAAGSTLSFPADRGIGITVDRDKGELVVTDPPPGQLKPVMPFMVEVTSAAGLKTLYPFKVISSDETAVPN